MYLDLGQDGIAVLLMMCNRPGGKGEDVGRYDLIVIATLHFVL